MLFRSRRRAEEARAHAVASGTTHAFDPNMPWDYCFKAATLDQEFWDSELEKKCLLYITHLRTAAQLKDDGTGVPPEWMSSLDQSGKKRRTDGNAMQEAGASSSAHQAPPGTGKGRRARAAASGAGNRAGKNKASVGTGKGSGRAPDGRFLANHNGEALCWKWNHAEGGCADSCLNGRAHQCEWCRSKDHRSINCSQKPTGWSPP